MNKELFELMTKILDEVGKLKSYIKERKQDKGIDLQATERIINRLDNIVEEADKELIDTLIRIEKNFDFEKTKSTLMSKKTDK
ncbi:hypothetical protein D0469_06335 [Peribacillus saganii]|uniref:Uncharacterized protein n=1 Tax=Peribacillus saganii TaxID=2303992 RepID=A0A372LR71_9BACI|nr:hypothetical protein [Peribacillus saganii]RFU70546.1 hypothetical protein D0469_06335 [Peribacillus saganii]